MKPYLVGVLYYGPIDREHDKCVEALRNHPYIATLFEMHGCPYIDIGRSTIATKVLDDESFGGLLFIDHDMIFDFAEVTKVIESAEACQGVVGGAYSMRRPGNSMIGGIDQAQLEPGEIVTFFEGGGCRPAVYLGMGFTAIHRSVFEKLYRGSPKKTLDLGPSTLDMESGSESSEPQAPSPKPAAAPAVLSYPELWKDPAHGQRTPDAAQNIEKQKAAYVIDLGQPALPRLKSGISAQDVVPYFSLLQAQGSYYGEDVSFCLRCHDAGIPVQMDTRIRVYHKGSYTYGLEDCGMVVPFCSTLKSLPSDSPQPKNAMYSHIPEAQAILDELEAARLAALPDATADEVLAFPQSTDPLAGQGVPA